MSIVAGCLLALALAGYLLRRRRAGLALARAEHADAVLRRAGGADAGEPFWRTALDQLPAGIREEFLPEEERLATRLAASAAPTVLRPELTEAQQGGRFTEDVGGVLVIPDSAPPAAPITEWSTGGVVKPVTVLRVDRRAAARIGYLPTTTVAERCAVARFAALRDRIAAGGGAVSEADLAEAQRLAGEVQDARAMLPHRSRGTGDADLSWRPGPPRATAGCQCPGCGSIPHA